MPGRSICTRCGATLPAPDLDGNQVCISCGLFHTTDPAAADAPLPPEPPAPPIPPVPPVPPPPPGASGPFGASAGGASFGHSGGPSSGTTAAPPGGAFSAGPQKVAAPPVGKKRGGIGCLLVAMVVVLVGVVGAIAGVAWLVDAVDEAGTTGPGGSRFRPLGGEVTVLRGDDGTPEQVAALASVYGSGDRTVVLAEPDDEGGEVIWDAQLVPDDVYSARFVATDDLVVAGLGRRVLGLDRATGETRWQAEVSDVLSPACSDCLTLVDGHVVVFSADAQVTVIDPADGSALWSRRLESASGWVKPFGDQLLVIDQPEGGATTVTLTEVADGAEGATHTPSCPDPRLPERTIEASPGSMVLERVPGTDDLVAQFSFGRACTTRWEATTGTLRWNRAIEEAVDTDAEAAITATDMVTSTSQGLIHASLAEGTVTVVAAPADSYLDGPVWLRGTTALAVATTTRGTPRALVVAIDLRSREQMWTLDLPQGAEPLVEGDTFGTTLFPGGAAFLVVPTDDALRLVTIEGGGRLTVSDVDPATGRTEIVGTDAVPGVSDSSTTIYLDSVGADDVAITVDASTHVVDLTTGTIAASWDG